MKQLIIAFITIFISFSVYSQIEAVNFKIEDNNRVIWQKIYQDSTVTFEDLCNTIKSNTKFSNINILNNKITFNGKGIDTNPGALGFSRGGTQFYALGDIQAFFTIDFKEDRYRVTAINITSAMPVISLGGIYAQNSDKYEQTPLEETAVSGKGFRKGFIKKESLIMNHAIEKQLTIQKVANDNW